MKNRKWIAVSIFAVLLFIGAGFGLLYAQKKAAAPKGPVERLLFEIDNNALEHSYTFSPDLKKVAYITINGKKQQVTINGKGEKNYDEVLETSLTFSPDNNHLAYWAKSDNTWRVIRDGSEGKPYDGFRRAQRNAPIRFSRDFSIRISSATTLAFSPDSRHLAYNAARGKKYLPVIDEKEGAELDGFGINGPFFGADSREIGYMAWRGEKAVVVVGEKTYGPYDSHSARGVLFSPAGGRWATIAWIGKKPKMLLDGKESPAYEEVSDLTFSDNGKRFAYVGKGANGKSRVVLEDVKGKEYDEIWCPRFSPAGDQIAYFARTGKKEFIVIDEKEGPSYGSAGAKENWFWAASYPVFGPDGKHVAYVASQGDGKFVVADGIAGKSYKNVWEPEWSADGKSIAYVAFREKSGAAGPSKEKKKSEKETSEGFLVIDSKETDPFDGIKSFSFSPHGGHFAFVATKGEKQFVVLDGNRGKRTTSSLTAAGQGLSTAIPCDIWRPMAAKCIWWSMECSPTGERRWRAGERRKKGGPPWAALREEIGWISVTCLVTPGERAPASRRPDRKASRGASPAARRVRASRRARLPS